MLVRRCCALRSGLRGASRRILIRQRRWQQRHFSSNSSTTSNNLVQVLQYRATSAPPVATSSTSSDNDEEDDSFFFSQKNRNTAIIYTPATADDDASSSSSAWMQKLDALESTSSPINNTTDKPLHVVAQPKLWLYDNVIRHFLPAHYPTSVDAGYGTYALYSALAATAGSASMVLSTQTLLLAVGVVGNTSAQAGIMAGALNWVLKDGVGQLGGILFASATSQSKDINFDANPKQWRVAAAVCLDVAAGLELLAPRLANTTFNWVLPTACVACCLKNVGFLTASASKAALHSSLATSYNLADVTAKSASQGMAAGLFGTAVGIGISMLAESSGSGGATVEQFGVAFGGLAVLHQGFTWAALRAVSLRHLNRHRMVLLLQAFVNTTSTGSDDDNSSNGIVLSPQQVAQHEVIVPVLPAATSWRQSSSTATATSSISAVYDDSHEWLTIGSDLPTICPGGMRELETLLSYHAGDDTIVSDDAPPKFLVNVVAATPSSSSWSLPLATSSSNDPRIHLTFLQDATGEDLIQGMLVALTLREMMFFQPNESTSTTTTTNDGILDAASSHSRKLLQAAHARAQAQFPALLAAMKAQGWRTGTDETGIEPSKAVRFVLQQQ